MSWRLWALKIAVVGLVGCTTSLTHEKLGPGAQPAKPGFTYYLPRQRYAVVATYELKSCPDGAAGTAQPLEVSQSVTVTESPIADPAQFYSIPIDTLTSGWKTTSLTVTLYENQTLHTFGATVDDRTGAIVKSTLGSALSVARVLVGIPTAAAASQLCHPEIYKALDVVRDSRTKLMDPALDEKTRAGWTAAAVAARSALTITETYLFDPSDEKSDVIENPKGEKVLKWFANPQLIGTAKRGEVLRYERTMSTGIRIQTKPSGREELPSTLEKKGVIYREPFPVVIEVCAGPCTDRSPEVLATMESHAAQFGRVAAIPLDNRAFEKNNLALSFAQNGRLESVTYGTESRLEKMAASVAESATSIEGFLAKEKAADDAAAKEAAGAELAALKAEIELLKAKADKIEAEKRLTGLTGGQ